MSGPLAAGFPGVVVPAMKNKNMPEIAKRVFGPRRKPLPQRGHAMRVEPLISANALIREDVVRPFTQRAGQPLTDGNVDPAFRAGRKVGGNIARQQLAKERLSSPAVKQQFSI